MRLCRYERRCPRVALVIGAVLVGGSLVTGGVRAAEQQGRIVVFGEASVDAEVIRLADVARLEGPAAEELTALEIGRAPAPGRMNTVSGAMILETLRGHGVDLERVRYLIPASVHVRRHSQEISAATIKAIAEDYLDSQLDQADGRSVVRSV